MIDDLSNALSANSKALTSLGGDDLFAIYSRAVPLYRFQRSNSWPPAVDSGRRPPPRGANNTTVSAPYSVARVSNNKIAALLGIHVTSLQKEEEGYPPHPETPRYTPHPVVAACPQPFSVTRVTRSINNKETFPPREATAFAAHLGIDVTSPQKEEDDEPDDRTVVSNISDAYSVTRISLDEIAALLRIPVNSLTERLPGGGGGTTQPSSRAQSRHPTQMGEDMSEHSAPRIVENRRSSAVDDTSTVHSIRSRVVTSIVNSLPPMFGALTSKLSDLSRPLVSGADDSSTNEDFVSNVSFGWRPNVNVQTTHLGGSTNGGSALPSPIAASIHTIVGDSVAVFVRNRGSSGIAVFGDEAPAAPQTSRRKVHFPAQSIIETVTYIETVPRQSEGDDIHMQITLAIPPRAVVSLGVAALAGALFLVFSRRIYSIIQRLPRDPKVTQQGLLATVWINSCLLLVTIFVVGVLSFIFHLDVVNPRPPPTFRRNLIFVLVFVAAILPLMNMAATRITPLESSALWVLPPLFMVAAHKITTGVVLPTEVAGCGVIVLGAVTVVVSEYQILSAHEVQITIGQSVGYIVLLTLFLHFVKDVRVHYPTHRLLIATVTTATFADVGPVFFVGGFGDPDIVALQGFAHFEVWAAAVCVLVFLTSLCIAAPYLDPVTISFGLSVVVGICRFLPYAVPSNWDEDVNSTSAKAWAIAIVGTAIVFAGVYLGISGAKERALFEVRISSDKRVEKTKSKKFSSRMRSDSFTSLQREPKDDGAGGSKLVLRLKCLS